MFSIDVVAFEEFFSTLNQNSYIHSWVLYQKKKFFYSMEIVKIQHETWCKRHQLPFMWIEFHNSLNFLRCGAISWPFDSFILLYVSPLQCAQKLPKLLFDLSKGFFPDLKNLLINDEDMCVLRLWSHSCRDSASRLCFWIYTLSLAACWSVDSINHGKKEIEEWNEMNNRFNPLKILPSILNCSRALIFDDKPMNLELLLRLIACGFFQLKSNEF